MRIAMAWVEPMEIGDEFVYDLWIDPETGDDVDFCPWWKRHQTRIATSAASTT